MLPQIYVPTTTEIVKVTASAKQRHPESAARIDKARDVLLSGSLTLEPVGWEVRNCVRWHVCSQSHAKAAYLIVGQHCPCQDSRAPMIGHVRFCKHSMAVSLYNKLLRNHLNSDIRARQIDLGILHTGEFHAYAGTMGYVQVRKVGATYDFSDAASMVRYSIWLQAQQQPVAVEWPVAHSVALAA